jgi:di/tricarboxylate transporter
VRLIQRSGHLILPPFEGYSIHAGDILIVAATRKMLIDALAKFPGFFISDHEMLEMERRRQESAEAAERQVMATEKKADEIVKGEAGEDDEVIPKTHEELEATKSRVLAEIMITPASRLIDMSLDQAGFQRMYGVVVLGIQRRARVVRRRLGRVRLEDGDVLLIACSQAALDNMRGSTDFIVMAGTVRDLPMKKKAPIAGVVFLGTIASAALGIMPIPVAAVAGAVMMLATGCMNFRQAVRALDRKIFLLVGAALALGTTLEVTKAAGMIADSIMLIPFAEEPIVMVSILFLIVAIMTNLLSNNACAILFTPIAMSMGANANIDPFVMASTVIFAANCSFASPIGYQTNLLVMGPGHYRFRDFMQAGIPLVLIVWGTYIAIAKFYYGL